MLSQAELKSHLHYDPETGVFTRAGKPIGRPEGLGSHHRYRRILIDGRMYYAHRLAWLYVTGDWPKQIDHRDRNGLNNRFSNLRLADRTQNRANAKRHSNNRSGFKGVVAEKSRWRAQVGRRRIGVFDTPEAAHVAYLAAAKRVFGDYANDGN